MTTGKTALKLHSNCDEKSIEKKSIEIFFNLFSNLFFNLVFSNLFFFHMDEPISCVHLKIQKKKNRRKNSVFFLRTYICPFFKLTAEKTALKFNSVLIFHSFPVVKKRLKKRLEKRSEKRLKKRLKKINFSIFFSISFSIFFFHHRK